MIINQSITSIILRNTNTQLWTPTCCLNPTFNMIIIIQCLGNIIIWELYSIKLTQRVTYPINQIQLPNSICLLSTMNYVQPDWGPLSSKPHGPGICPVQLDIIIYVLANICKLSIMEGIYNNSSRLGLR